MPTRQQRKCITDVFLMRQITPFPTHVAFIQTFGSHTRGMPQEECVVNAITMLKLVRVEIIYIFYGEMQICCYTHVYVNPNWLKRIKHSII